MIRKIDWLHHASSRQLIQHVHEINLIQEPFSDTDIFELQEKFLTNGFHYLKAQNIAKGRSIIKKFLKILALYQDIACLTVNNQSALPEHTIDIYYDLTTGGYLNTFQPYYLEEYFFDFYHDFMWIEANQELLLSSWFDNVITKIIDMAIDQHIPIVVIVYED